MRAALYLHVSTRDGRQTTENQWLQLRKFAYEQRWSIFAEYTDTDTGSKAGEDRTGGGFRDMMEAAQARKFDVLLFWSLPLHPGRGV